MRSTETLVGCSILDFIVYCSSDRITETGHASWSRGTFGRENRSTVSVARNCPSRDSNCQEFVETHRNALRSSSLSSYSIDLLSAMATCPIYARNIGPCSSLPSGGSHHSAVRKSTDGIFSLADMVMFLLKYKYTSHTLSNKNKTKRRERERKRTHVSSDFCYHKLLLSFFLPFNKQNNEHRVSLLSR